MRAITIVAAAALVGCGDAPASGADAATSIEDAATPIRTPCWPGLAGRTEAGSASIGTGHDGFEAMPEVLPLEYGSQAGYMLIANVRMSGLAPGNPDDVLDRGNPRTRIRAFFDETNVPLNFYAYCPFRYGYVPNGSGEYELGRAAPIIFETCWRSEHLFGKRIRLELEIIDSSGAYTTDTKIVTAAPPVEEHPIEQGTPGCKHRFVAEPALQDP